jgi:hypothetical protein
MNNERVLVHSNYLIKTHKQIDKQQQQQQCYPHTDNLFLSLFTSEYAENDARYHKCICRLFVMYFWLLMRLLLLHKV